MSNSVDQRIVEMQFDNAQFEKGVASTLRSLMSLEKGLQLSDGVSGIEKVQAAAEKLSFSSAEHEISGLSSALGGLKDTAVNVFDHITNGIGTLAKGYALVKGIFSAGIGAMAIQGGWNRASNLNKAAFKLDAMGVGWKNVSDSVSEAVDGTAYSLDAAATSAALFASSGVKAGDDMTRALKATANLASISGSSFEHIGDIMAKVAAQGKLTGMQIDSFMFAGIDVAGILKDELNLTQEGFEKLKKEGISLADWVDVIMNRFGDAAGLANNSFDGAMGNMRSALNRTFADLFQYGQMGMVPVFNSIRESINTVNAALKPLLGAKWMWFDPAQGKEIERQGVLIEGFVGIMEEASKAIEGFGGYWDDATGKRHYNSEFFNRTNRIVKMFAEGLMGPIAEIKAGTNDLVWGVLRLGASGREIFRLAMELISPIGMAFHDLFGNGSFARATKAFSEGASNILETLANLKVSTGFINLARTAFQALFGVLKGAGAAVFNAVGGAIQGFVIAASGVGVFVGHLVDMFDRMNRAGVDAADAFAIAMSPIVNMTKDIPVIGNLVAMLAELPKGVSALIDAAAGNDGAFEKLSTFITKHSEKIAKIGEDVGNGFRAIGNGVREFADKIGGFAVENVPKVFEQLKNAFSVILPVLGVVPYMLGQFGDKLRGLAESSGLTLSALSPYLEAIGKSFKIFFDGISQGNVDFPRLGKNLGNIFDVIGSRIKNFVSQILPDLPAPFQEFFSRMGEVGSVVSDVAGRAGRVLGDFAGKIGDAIGEAKKHLKLEAFESFAKRAKILFEQFYSGSIDFGSLAKGLSGAAKLLFSTFRQSVAEAISAFWASLREGLSQLTQGDGISSTVTSFFAKIFKKLSALKLPALPELSINPLETLTNFIDFLKNFLASFNAPDFVKGIGDALPNFDIVEKIWSKISGFLDGVKGIGQAIGDAATHPFETVGSLVAGLVNGLASMIDTFVSKLDVGKISKFAGIMVAIGASAGIIVGIYKLSQVFGAIGELAKSISSFPKALGGAIESLGGVFDQVKKNLKLRNVRMIAESVALIAGSLIALTFIDKGKLWEVIPIVGVITAVMVALTLLFGILSSEKFSGKFNFEGIGVIGEAMMNLAKALIIVIAALAIASAAKDAIADGAGPILAILAVFTIMSAIFTKIDTAGIAAGGEAMMAIAKSLLLIYAAAAMFGHMDEATAEKGIPIVIKLMLLMSLMAGLIGFLTGLSKGSSMMSGMAGTFLGMAAMLFVLGAVAEKIGGMDQGDIDKAMQTLQDMVALASIMAIVVGVIGTLGGGPAKIAAPLLAMSAAIAVLALSVAALAAVSAMGGDLGGAMMAIAGGLVAMGVALALIGTFGPQVAAAGASILLFTVAFAAFIAIALALTQVPWEAIGSDLVYVAAAFAAFAIAIAVIGAIGDAVGTGLFALAVAFAVFSAGMLVLSAALLVGVSALSLFTAIAEPAVAALSSLFNMLIEAFKTEDFVGSIIGTAVALTLLGVAAAALGIGLGILDLALWGVAVVFPKAAMSIVNFFTVLSTYFTQNKDLIANGITNMLEAGVQGIAGFFGKFLTGGQELGENLGKGFPLAEGQVRSGVSAILGTVGTLLWEGITTLGPVLLDLIKEIALGILDGLATAITGPVEWLNDKLYELTGGWLGVAPTAEESTSAVADAAAEGLASRDEDLGESTKAKIDELEEHIRGEAPNAGAASQEMADAITNPFEQTGANFDFFQAMGLDETTLSGGFESVKGFFEGKGIELPDELITQFASGATGFDAWNMIQSNGNVDLSQFTNLMGEGGVSGADSFTDSFSSQMTLADISNLVADATAIDTEALNEKFSSAAGEAAQAFTTGFSDNIEIDGSGPIDKAVDSIKKSSGSMTDAGSALGKSVTDGFKKGAKDMKSNAKDSVKNAIDAVTGQKSTAQSGGYDVGNNMGAGLKSGLQSGSNGLATLAASIVRDAINAMKSEAKTKSPSKETIWLSEMMMQGLVVGFDNLRQNVADSAASVMTESLSAMGDAAYIADLLNDIDDQPTIRPVLDLTDYEAGIQRMRGLNASAPLNSAQWANRLTSSGSDSSYYNNNRSMVINLNYGVGTSAADMVNEMAMILQTKNLMEA